MIGTNSKTFSFEQNKLPIPDVSFSQSFIQKITDWEIRIRLSKCLMIRKVYVAPYISISISRNLFDELTISNNVSNNGNDSFTYSPGGTNHVGQYYTSLGADAGLSLSHKTFLIRVSLRLGYAVEFGVLPQETYNISASKGNISYNHTVKYQGYFSYFNIDIGYNLFQIDTKPKK
jgi:hypothetical protein